MQTVIFYEQLFASQETQWKCSAQNEARHGSSASASTLSSTMAAALCHSKPNNQGGDFM